VARPRSEAALHWCYSSPPESLAGRPHDHETVAPTAHGEHVEQSVCTHRRPRGRAASLPLGGSAVDTVYPHCAGLDVHKDTVVACVRHHDGGRKARQEVRTFPTYTRGLEELADCLAAEG